ncbi:regulator component [Kitasatospora sp. NPDC094011]|uniref:regulator component n=1 Tax=Kitasatospora sp. NPDC094011 TaxID=3364090 RepID=UPI003819676F
MAFPRGLRRRCEQRLSGLSLPTPFTVEGFRAALEQERGRRIVMEPLPALGPDLPCGLWIALPSIDVVYYEERTSPAHQDLIKLHELGHVLCGHTGTLELSRLTALLPDLTPELIAQLLGAGRTGYHSAEEQEAEMIALLLADLAGAPTDPDSGHLAESLLHPIRRPRWRNP